MCNVYLALSKKLISYSLGGLTNITTHRNFVKMELEDISRDFSTKNIIKLNYATSEIATKFKLLPSIDELLKNIVAKAGFISHEISRRVVLNNDSSYLGDLYEIDIRGETKDGPKEINAFLKQASADETMNILCDIKTCYSKEVLFYTELSDIFDTLQNSVDIPDKEKFQIAKSYECNSDAIILENLCKKGFETLRCFDVMPLYFAELSIEQLAKLNGLGFVMNNRRKDYFDKNIKTLKCSVRFDEINVWKNLVKKIITTLHFTRDTQEKVDYFLQNSFYAKYPKYITGDTDSVRSLCHGDFRISNVMMKKNAKEETEVVLIDYQFLLYRSPVIDLLYFLYTGTDRKFRKAHMNNLKDLYHKKLTEFLKYFDININDVYPKNDFEKDFVDSLDFGLIVALYVCPIIFKKSDNKDTDNDKSFKMDDRTKERINEVVEEFIEWGILK